MINDPMLVWYEPMNRAKARVIASDISKAIAWFKEKTGQEATRVCLNPKLANLPIHEGIEVEYIGGCLAWEIWLSVGNNNKDSKAPEPKIGGLKAIQGVNYPPGNLSTLKEQKIEVDKLKPSVTVDKLKPSVTKVTREKPGPKPTGLPDGLIKQWASEGMGNKAIVAKLEKEYRVVVSYKTIQRRLQGILL